MPIDYTKGPKPEPEQPPGGGVSLNKVTLTKAAPAVSLSKQGSAGGEMRVNLSWNAKPAGSGGGGLFKRRSSGGIDLDLAAMYEYADGSKGVVQALGNAFRDRHSFGPNPIVRLDGEDRSGGGGENLFVDLNQVQAIRRILVFAFIYEGVPNWAAADAVVTLFPASGPQVEIRLDEHDPRSPTVALAMLVSEGGELFVKREVRYIQGAQDALDRAYGWGMQWKAGRK